VKDTFYRLPDEKKQKIIDSCIQEFGEHGYDNGSTDRIIQKSGISKGGLYEYIHSKEELFLYIVDYSYKSLYLYIKENIRKNYQTAPADILDLFQLVSSIAIEFYLEHPKMIEFIVKANLIQRPVLADKIEKLFLNQFLDVFGDIDTENLRFSKEQSLGLLRWLLLKTRNDFLTQLISKNDVEQVKKAYFENWDFFIKVLQDGIYRK
jgi:TetR/AcrR family transcriptional regulator